MQKLQSEAGSRHDADQGAEGIGLVWSQLLKLGACSNRFANSNKHSFEHQQIPWYVQQTQLPGHGHGMVTLQLKQSRYVSASPQVGGGFLIGHISGDPLTAICGYFSSERTQATPPVMSYGE